MRLSYDPQYNIAYLRFKERQTEVESVRVSDELVVDMAPDGTVYGVELLNANTQLGQEGFVVVNEATREEVKLPIAPS